MFKFKKRQIAAAILGAGLSAFVLFQNCAKATFNLPTDLNSAQAQAIINEVCVGGRTVPCEDQTGSGIRCEQINPDLPPIPEMPPENLDLRKILRGVAPIEEICAKDHCNPGYHLVDFQCVADPCDPGPFACEMLNGVGQRYRYCPGNVPTKLDPNIISEDGYGPCMVVSCNAGYSSSVFACHAN